MSIVGAFAVPHPPLIIPGVGRGREHEIQHTIDAYEEVGRRVAALAPQTIVVTSPHSVMYRDYFHISPGRRASGSFSQYGDAADRYTVAYDQDFVRELCAAADAEGLAAGTEGERDPSLDHATMIPLHFVQHHYRDFQAVRIGLSGLSVADHYRLGMLVRQVAEKLDRRVVLIASGDLSHKLTPDGPYGFAPEGPVFDERVTSDFATGDFLDLLEVDRGFAERAAECGLRSFQIMAGAFDRTAVHAELLSYEGPFGVGYGVGAFTPVGPDPARNLLDQYLAWHARQMAARKAAEYPLVRLARLSLETYVTSGRRLKVPDQLPADLPAELADTRAGCFVSLKEDGELRGCIGTILPTRASLAEEIVANAVSAGYHDPRFSPVRAEELPELVYDVDVLTTPEPVPSEKDLDPKRYGVIVSCDDGRRGLLLPDLDGVDTVEEQVRIAARKGGISVGYDDYRLERFEVVRHV